MSGTTAARTPAEREHYRDFYDGPERPPTGAPLLAVLGNCQAESLRLLLDDEDVRTVRVPPVHELGPGDVAPLQRLVARLDLLVAQPVAEDYHGLPLGTAQVLEQAPPGLQHALVPVVRHAGAYPCQLVVHPPGLVDPVPPVVAYHDVRTAVRAAWDRAGRPPPEPGDPDPDLARRVVAQVSRDSQRELEVREAAHGTVVASDLLLRPAFTAMRTVNHPGNAVLAPLAARVRARLGLAARATRVTRPLLDGVRAPREAWVARVLDPSGDPARVARGTWLVGGRAVPAAEVDAAQRAFYAARPDVLEVVLDRAAGLRSLLGLRLPDEAAR